MTRVTGAPRLESLQARLWSEEEFRASAPAWEGLLAESDADPLFMCWDWQWRWWRHHAAGLGATLHLLAIYDSVGDLAGLAPFYSRRARARRLLSARRLELLGGAWREPRTVFSEYLDVIALRGSEPPVLDCIARWLAGERLWSELVLPHARSGSLVSRLAATQLRRLAYVRATDPLDAWYAQLPGQFSDYVAALRSDVRRRLCNHRARLHDVRIEEAGDGDVASYLESLWRLADRRWGHESGGGHFRSFHTDFATAMARQGRLRLTRLTARGSVLSVLYDVRVGDTEYYLQSGFDAGDTRGLSLGYLHLGYAIESACRDGIRRFDMLAGRGRRRGYKRDLCTERLTIATHQAVRGIIARRLYAAYDRLILSDRAAGQAPDE